LSIAETPRSPLVVWRFSDGKRGHDNQSLGLVDALTALKPVVRHDIDAGRASANPIDYLLGRFPAASSLPDPHLLVGAGHATHLPMLFARRARGGRIVVLMKPTLPRRWFDLCVIPRHDGVAAAPGVFLTDGAINRIRPAAGRDERSALILLGGPSAHVAWDDAGVHDIVSKLIAAVPSLDWRIADSRRTPSSLRDRLRQACATRPGVRYVHWQDVDDGWLADQMSRCTTIWVTSDSVSMLYEALSSGAAVGLIPVPSRGPSRGPSRVARGLEDLLRRGWLLDSDEWCANPTVRRDRPVLEEARRCARYIADEWLATA
jgi:mitochondrial fission protein ELM1